VGAGCYTHMDLITRIKTSCLSCHQNGLVIGKCHYSKSESPLMTNRFLTTSITGVKRTRVTTQPDMFTSEFTAANAHAADTTIHFTRDSITHDTLSGLLNDDHPQYIVNDGSRGQLQTAVSSMAYPELHLTGGGIEGGLVVGPTDDRMSKSQTVSDATHTPITVQNQDISSPGIVVKSGRIFSTQVDQHTMSGLAFTTQNQNGLFPCLAGMDVEFGPNVLDYVDTRLIFKVKKTDGQFATMSLDNNGVLGVYEIAVTDLSVNTDLDLGGRMYARSPSCNMYVDSNTDPTVIVSQSTPQAITLSASDSAFETGAVMVHESPGVIRMQSSDNAQVHVTASLSFTPSDAAETTWIFYMYKERAPNPWQPVPGGKSVITTDSSTKVVSVTMSTITEMEQNSAIRLFVSNETNTNALVCNCCSMNTVWFPSDRGTPAGAPAGPPSSAAPDGPPPSGAPAGPPPAGPPPAP